MKISVVVPVYNVESYIDKCLESLLSQTFQPYEIILVDDESTDNSGKISDEYSRKYDFIKVIHKKNGGLGFARNTGIENAEGDWIVFLDSDDYFSETLLSNLVDYQKKYNADIVIGGYKKVNNDGEVLFEYKYEDNIYSDIEITNSLLPRFLGSSPSKSDAISMSVCNCLFSLKIIEKYNIRFPSERYVISEDLFFNFDYYIHASKVVLTSTTEYYYRSTQGSLTTRYRANRFELSKNLYVEILQCIKNNNLGNDAEYRIMRSMFNYWRMCFAQEERCISQKNRIDQFKAIDKICSDITTVDILKKYPIYCLNFKQKVFLYIVKYKLINILVLLIQIGFFRMT